jgi:asparagine synthetase B (glutamine-hydrolysing)
MCGLCGVARHPTDSDPALAKQLFTDLLKSIEVRGTDATGLAACGGSDSFIWKVAKPVSTVVHGKGYAKAMDRITDDTSVILGHTRQAFVPTGTPKAHSSEREAAHPFQVGNVIGAHNGVIYNWRSLIIETLGLQADSFFVDSQVALAVLNTYEKQKDALELLEGYFALSWWKNRRLYLARTQEAPLACAYLPEKQILLWNSELPLLEDVLKLSGITEFHAWILPPNVIHEIAPKKLTSSYAMNGRAITPTSFISAKHYKGINSADPSRSAQLSLPRMQPRVRARPERTASLLDLMERIERLECENEELREAVSALADAVFIDDCPEQSFDVCVKCRQGEEAEGKGRLLSTTNGHCVHEECIFGA